MELVFDWDSSSDYSSATSTLTYEIADISNASSTLSTIETASTTATTSINEFGRPYNFSIQAFDKDGFGSTTSTNSISVPDLPEKTGVLYSQTEGSSFSETFAWSPRASLIQETEPLSLINTNKGWTLKIKTENNLIPYAPYGNVLMACNGGWMDIIYPDGSKSWDAETKTMTYHVADNWITNHCGQTPQNIDIFSCVSEPCPRIYGATSDNYVGYDAVWINNYGNTTGSDTEITDIYFVIEQEE